MFKMQIMPRFNDIDGLRHINNTVIPQWFEQAKEPIMRFFNPEMIVDFEHWNLIMARMSVYYVSQMKLAEVEIRTWVSHVGNSSVVIYQEAWQGGVLGAKGEYVCVHFDFIKNKSVSIPDDIRVNLLKHSIGEATDG